MKCFICNGNTTKTTSRYTIRDNNHFHVITIPCLKCEQCGECYIDGCTLQNIESIPPDEWDQKMLKEIQEDPDCKEFVSSEDALKELGLYSSR